MTTETTQTTAEQTAEKKVREVKVHQPGVRGFTFGKVWNKSVVDGKGLALHASNLPKLQAQARAEGVEDVENLTQEALAQAVAAKLALKEIVAAGTVVDPQEEAPGVVEVPVTTEATEPTAPAEAQ